MTGSIMLPRNSLVDSVKGQAGRTTERKQPGPALLARLVSFGLLVMLSCRELAVSTYQVRSNN